MRFVTFVKENALQDDPALRSFAEFVLQSKEFSLSSDPAVLAVYLYKKLNHLQTKGFQVFLMLYKQTQSNNQLPENIKNNDPAFIDAINIIINLQNNDPDYRDF